MAKQKRKSKRAKAQPVQRRQRRSQSGLKELNEALAVFGKAERMYATLASKREYLTGELEKVDGALASLQQVIAAKDGRAPAPARRGRPPKAAASTPVPSGGRLTLGQAVLAVLSRASAPMNAADIAAAVRKEARGIGTAGLQKVLRDLRDRGKVKASGKAKRFHYSVAGSRAASVAPAAAPSSKKASKKKAGGGNKRGARGGGPTVREIILDALPKGRSLRIAEIVTAVVAKRSDVKPNSVETIIHRLRRDGQIKSSGASGDYRYSRS